MSWPSGDPLHLIVGSVGGFAADAIVGTCNGRVSAVFERSAYIELGGQMLCIGGRGIRCGPLNALVESPDAIAEWLATLEPGEGVRGAWPQLRSSSARLDFARAMRWRPPRLALPIDSRRLAQGIVAMRSAARARTPADGLAFLVTGIDAATPLAQPGRDAANVLHDWLTHDGTQADLSHAQALREVIGLGPGLTPSGDDFLGGALVALHAFGRADRARALAGWLLPLCAHATHPISVAHLVAAAHGEGGEALHGCLVALAEGRDADEALDGIGSVGHTSGWDTLAGALTVAAAI
jgi:Protein of unknown function (DUF2877)